MTELIATSSDSGWGENETLDNSTDSFWDEYKLIDSHTLIESDEPVSLFSNSIIPWGEHELVDSDVSINSDSFEVIDTSVSGIRAGTHSVDTGHWLKYDFFTVINTNVLGIRAGTHSVDTGNDCEYQSVDVYFEKEDPFREYRYIPTSDFNIDSELIGFTSDFTYPVDLTDVKTRLSPVDSGMTYPWKRTTPVDIYQEIKWGYGLNDFLVGGSVKTYYPVDDDAINPPIEPPVPKEVIRIVNVVNVVKLPERTAIKFTDFTLAIDLDSIAWVVNFTIADSASLALLKPVGLTTVDVEININGELFVCFIGRTKTSISANSDGSPNKSYKCTGWSRTKLLTYPYSNRRSHTEISSSTPAGIMTDELTGSGFTGNWSSPSWTIPANVFSYFEKSPLAAIIELTESIGSVIIPSDDTNSFTVKPYYPLSPWNWDSATVDFTLSETEFYTIDTEWIPKQSPDSIYIYGEETGGVAVKAVKQGTAGLVTLPTIVNKYITDTIAGVERGRIEVGKAAFKEIIPVTTYVDATDGIIKPQSLLQVNALEGGFWRGMVIGTTISCKRVGTAVVQGLRIERHYD